MASLSQIDLSWEDGIGESRYELWRREEMPGLGWTSLELIAEPAMDATGYSVEGLGEGHTYKFRIRACAGVTCSGYATSPVRTTHEATTDPPDAPGALDGVVASSSQIDFHWDDVTGETRYELQRREGVDGAWAGFSTIATLAPNTIDYGDAGLIEGHTYRHRIRACNEHGCSGYTNYTGAKPATPGSFATVVASESQIDLSWDDVADEVHYELWRQEQVLGTWTEYSKIGMPAADATGYSDTGLTKGRTLRYRIRACGVFACSAWATGAVLTTHETTLTPPDTPGDFTAVEISASQIDLLWNDVLGEARYELQRQVGLFGGGWSAYSKVAVPAQDVLGYHDTPLPLGLLFRYRIRACNEHGCSRWVISPIVEIVPTN